MFVEVQRSGLLEGLGPGKHLNPSNARFWLGFLLCRRESNGFSETLPTVPKFDVRSRKCPSALRC